MIGGRSSTFGGIIARLGLFVGLMCLANGAANATFPATVTPGSFRVTATAYGDMSLRFTTVGEALLYACQQYHGSTSTIIGQWWYPNTGPSTGYAPGLDTSSRYRIGTTCTKPGASDVAQSAAVYADPDCQGSTPVPNFSPATCNGTAPIAAASTCAIKKDTFQSLSFAGTLATSGNICYASCEFHHDNSTKDADGIFHGCVTGGGGTTCGFRGTGAACLPGATVASGADASAPGAGTTEGVDGPGTGSTGDPTTGEGNATEATLKELRDGVTGVGGTNEKLDGIQDAIEAGGGESTPCGAFGQEPCAVVVDEGDTGARKTEMDNAMGGSKSGMEGSMDAIKGTVEGASTGDGAGDGFEWPLAGVFTPGVCVDPTIEANGEVHALPICEKLPEIKPWLNWGAAILTVLGVWSIFFGGRKEE